jgi:hypothetical protein
LWTSLRRRPYRGDNELRDGYRGEPGLSDHHGGVADYPEAVIYPAAVKRAGSLYLQQLLPALPLGSQLAILLIVLGLQAAELQVLPGAAWHAPTGLLPVPAPVRQVPLLAELEAQAAVSYCLALIPYSGTPSPSKSQPSAMLHTGSSPASARITMLPAPPCGG